MHDLSRRKIDFREEYPKSQKMLRKNAVLEGGREVRYLGTAWVVFVVLVCIGKYLRYTSISVLLPMIGPEP